MFIYDGLDDVTLINTRRLRRVHENGCGRKSGTALGGSHGRAARAVLALGPSPVHRLSRKWLSHRLFFLGQRDGLGIVDCAPLRVVSATASARRRNRNLLAQSAPQQQMNLDSFAHIHLIGSPRSTPHHPPPLPPGTNRIGSQAGTSNG